MKIKRREIAAHSSSLSEYPPLLQRIYAARGITDKKTLDKKLQAMHPFAQLENIDAACSRIAKAIQHHENILIVGDFDADGATSTALAVSALKVLGAARVDYLVPNRFKYGYGLTADLVVEAENFKKPNLIITVDNGIASIDGVAKAKSLGIDVIITDHHLPGQVLPDAVAIVNPNQHGDKFPSKSIAGVGVIFYVMVALRRHLSDVGWFNSQKISEPNMAQFLDLVALGTIADVVSLDQNNRILVNQGLHRIQKGLCRAGIRALAEVSGRQLEHLRESDLGFAIAPRLNAAGRLDDMAHGIECLLAEDYPKALTLAKDLENLNVERRKIEAEMKADAIDALSKAASNVAKKNGSLPRALCLYEDNWHQGVIGILAGRIKEKFNRPVIAFAKVSDDELKGSARSIAGLNIRDVLADIDKEHPGLIIKFGGHAMAAGLSVLPEKLPEFKLALVTEVSKHINEEDCVGQILSDGALQDHEISIDVASMLRDAGPWGQSFPEPMFDDVFEILEQRIVGQHHLKLILRHREGRAPIDAIAFNVDTNLWPNHRASYVHAAYKLDINRFQGRTKIQLLVDAIEAKESENTYAL